MIINNKADLHAAIRELEGKKAIQEADLVHQFRSFKESLNPINFIKNTFSKITEGPDFGGGLLKTATGIGVGVLSKKLFIGKSSSLLKKLLSPVFEFVVANTAIKNVDKVKAYGESIYHNLFKKNSNHDHTGTDLKN